MRSDAAQKRRAIAAWMVRRQVLRVRRWWWGSVRHGSHSRLVWCGSQWCPYIADVGDRLTTEER